MVYSLDLSARNNTPTICTIEVNYQVHPTPGFRGGYLFCNQWYFFTNRHQDQIQRIVL